MTNYNNGLFIVKDSSAGTFIGFYHNSGVNYKNAPRSSRSPNYPDEYGALEDCEIVVISGAGFARATTFATESSYDFVSVDAVEYSGSGGTLASSGVPISDTVAIAWHSDDSEQRGAVEICGQACDANSCGEHGHCGAAGTSCDCSDGWSGASCDVRTTGQTAARALTWCLDRFALIFSGQAHLHAVLVLVLAEIHFILSGIV